MSPIPGPTLGTPLSACALRTRWALQALARCAAEATKAAGACRTTRRGSVRPSAGDAGPPPRPLEAMGLRFASPVLVAAGFDRRGRLLADAAALGVGGIESGSHRPAPGAHMPLTSISAALPQRMRDGALGRPCHGLSLLVPQAEEGRLPCRAALLQSALASWQAHADYAVLNPGRSGATAAECVELLGALAEVRDRLPRARRLALVAKLPAAWAAHADAGSWARRLVEAGADGLLVSAERAPRPATEVLRSLADAVGGDVCLISVGGIDSVREAATRLAAGAHLVQLHRALLAAPNAVQTLLAGLATLGGRPGSRPR